MTKPGEDLPTLFRSLGPDDAGFQARALAAAREAEQRWPLFKAIAPQKPPVTPALSDQDRQHWISQEKSEAGGRKPALSMPALSLPGLSDKLARGLDKMSGRVAADAPAQTPARQIEPAPPPAALPISVEAPSPIAQPDGHSILLSGSPKTGENIEASDSGLGLLATPAVEPETVEPAAPAAPRAKDPLAGIFSRLQGKEKPTKNSIATRSSVLSRLDKR